ncbi:hypothetical protein STAS_35629 [Striga asiatica]|uniref:Vacuolar protein sorting-associated protein 62 n=1 Tax=Striga asiatica TaxID=4170 RepID=A0A5A7RLK2_STRAF|nr:hypothetical protein STAS_35629 [Striga asiatica]
MGISFNFLNIFKKKKQPLPIETSFTLPSPLSSWPPGEGFASGTIDLGGLQIYQASKFTKLWATLEGGPDNLGSTFFEPTSIPDGFHMLGCYSQPNNKPLSGWVLVGKDSTNDPSNGSLKPPIDYTLVWTSENLKIKQEKTGYIWLPTPPNGYKAVGLVITGSPEKPALEKLRCVRSDFTELNENEALVWDSSEINIYSSRPRNRGIRAAGVKTGTFTVRKNGVDLDLPCLKNASGEKNYYAMPNKNQIEAIIEAYSPRVYFHPDEEYFPCSVKWYFENGALLYKNGDESNPVRIDPEGSNLPEGGENDDNYWIDLPTNNSEVVKKGDLSSACCYLHVKPMFGGTFSDVAIWLFYPFNGPARAKVKFFDVSLGRIGEHVGDWEHVTLRVSNFDGELKGMYFSEHSGGVWLDVSELEFVEGNRPGAFSSFHGHAMYPKEGLVLQGNGSIGIRNDSGKGKFLDVGSNYLVVGAEYLGPDFVEPRWVNYMRKWGPKIEYRTEDEMKKVEKLLPGKLKDGFERFMRGLPNEVFGEDGPTGPKVKDSWAGDERS